MHVSDLECTSSCISPSLYSINQVTTFLVQDEQITAIANQGLQHGHYPNPFQPLHLYRNYTSTYQFLIEYQFRNEDGAKLSLTPLTVASLIFIVHLMQTHSEIISYLFCIQKSHQLSLTSNQECKIWICLISRHYSLTIVVHASPLTLAINGNHKHRHDRVYLYYFPIIKSISTSYTSPQCQSTAIRANNICPIDYHIGNGSLIYSSRSTFSVNFTQQWYTNVIKPSMTQQVLEFNIVLYQP